MFPETLLASIEPSRSLKIISPLTDFSQKSPCKPLISKRQVMQLRLAEHWGGNADQIFDPAGSVEPVLIDGFMFCLHYDASIRLLAHQDPGVVWIAGIEILGSRDRNRSWRSLGSGIGGHDGDPAAEIA